MENGDTSGATNDFNLYYFVAAAGTRVSVRLERADASLPWEHPDSLDPKVTLIAPDGFVYENEGRQDVTPATDLNAQVTDLTLPQTGMWLIAASTSRGHGDYRLSYTMTVPGSVPLAQRIVPFTGRGTTAQVGTDVRLTVGAMDPRGYLLSGARVTYTASYPDPGMGTVVWPEGRGAFTAVDGLAQVRLRSTTRGAIDVGTNLSDINNIITNASPDPATEALVETTLATLPRYQPLEHHPYVVRDVDPDGNVTLDLGPVKTFEPSRPSRLRTEWKSGPGGVKTLGTSPAPDHEPALAPRPLPPTESLVIPACTASTPFRHVAVEAPELKTPYTVTLKDVSPGKPSGGVPIGEKGIEGYRIEKNVKLELDVKDRDGNPPPHPVLVRLAVGGPRSGQLLVGPEGAQRSCSEAFVVWHEADSQGNPGTQPVAFEYKLGTLSLLPGVEPDPDHPGQVKPVWGVAEVLEATTEAVTPEATFLDQTVFPVRPQPGKPKSLVDWDGPPEDDRWEWWNSFYTYYDPAKQARAVWVTNYNAYTLVDKYGNTVWGCRDTRTTHGGSRLTVNLPYQETTGPDFRAYALEMKWWADGSDQMPGGSTTLDLFVGYPADPDWEAGEVFKRTRLDLQVGNQTHLKSYGGYEARFGMDDGTFPMSVSLNAHDSGIPKVGPGPALAPTRSLEAPRRMALVLLTGREAPSTQEVFRAPHRPWEWSGGAWVPKQIVPAPDPKIDVSSKPRLKLKLIDVNGNIQASAGFKVHLCPRFDHEGSPAAPEWACPTAPVESTNGEIAALAMNPGVVGNGDPPSPDATGYLGLELTRAPTAPGTYYVYVESLDKDVKIRDQSLLHLDDTPEGQYQGGFALCTVTGAEILDENFQRISPELVITQPTPIYVRWIDPQTSQETLSAAVDTRYPDGSVFAPAQPVTLTRVGRSSAWVGPATLQPPTSPTPASARLAAASNTNTLVLAAPPGPGLITAMRAGVSAQAATIVPRQLRIEFLNEAGTSVVPSPVVTIVRTPDPDEPGHSLFVEDCLVRIQAYLPSNVPDTTARGVVSLREKPVSTFLPEFVLTYQGEKNAASLLANVDAPQVGDGQKDYAVVELAEGGHSIPLHLRSLASQRRGGSGEPISPWQAQLVAVPSVARPSAFMTSPVTYVEQWVDQVSVGALGTSILDPPIREPNGIPDWVEYSFWNAVTGMRSANGITKDVGDSVTRFRASTAPAGAPAAFFWVDSDSPSDVKVVDIGNLLLDNTFRVDGRSESSAYWGHSVYYSHGVTGRAFHEARHSWQFAREDTDHDGVADGLPDSGASYYQDAPHIERPGGTNPEFDFLGTGTAGRDEGMPPVALRERDALRWAFRNNHAVLGSNVSCSGVDQMTPAVGSTVVYDYGARALGLGLLEIPVKVNALTEWLGPTGGRFTGEAGVLVRAEMVVGPLPGEEESGHLDTQLMDRNLPSQTALVETDGLGGIATLRVAPVFGLNLIRVTATHVTPTGSGGRLVGPCSSLEKTEFFIKVRGQ